MARPKNIEAPRKSTARMVRGYPRKLLINRIPMTLAPSQLTGPDGNCPELSVQYQELMDLICQKLGDARVYIDGQDQALSDRIDSLAGDSALADRLTQLQSLINTLDADGDGTLSELTGLQAQIDDLLARVVAVESATAANASDISADGQRLTDYIASNNAAISDLQSDILAATTTAANALEATNTTNGRVNSVEVNVANQGAQVTQNRTDITALQQEVAGLLGSDAVDALMDEAECRARKAVAVALTSAANQLAQCSAFPAAPVAPSGDGDATVI